MRTIKSLFPIVILVLSLHQGLQAQKVETFVEKFNERKIDEIQKLGKGYISPSLLKDEKFLVRPLVVVTHEEAKEIIDNYSNGLIEGYRNKGKEPRDKDLDDLKKAQKRLSIAWTDMLFIVREAGVDVVALKHKIKDSDLNSIVIVFASNGEVVMVKAIGSVDSKIDDDKMQLKGREIWISDLKKYKSEVDRPGGDQPATKSEDKPATKDQPTTSKDGPR